MTKVKNNGVSIPLLPEEEWEEEGGHMGYKEPVVPPQEPTGSAVDYSNLSEVAISYLAQIQDLQEQLEQENLKVQRLEMAIRGFSMALQEELEGAE